LGAILLACNLKYSGDRSWKDLGLRPSLGKKVSEIPVSTNKPRMVVYVCNLIAQKVIGRRISVQATPSKNVTSYPKVTKAKKWLGGIAQVLGHVPSKGEH
jgi:hypothetical protein